MREIRFRHWILVVSALCALGLAGCDGGPQGSGSGLNGFMDAVGGTGGPVNPAAGTSHNAPAGSVIGDSCKTGGADHICLALHFVAYNESNTSQQQAINLIQEANSLWGQCNLGFQIEKYEATAHSGLPAVPATNPDLDDIRNTFNSPNMLLVAVTQDWAGAWGSVNAWTNMPGGGPYGAIFDGSVNTFGNIFAHELGHYLNLSHVPDTSDVMDAVIYPTSTTFTPDQCDAARSAANTFWGAMER